MRHQTQPPKPIPQTLVTTLLGLLAGVSLTQGVTLDDKYCRVQNSTLTDQIYRELTLPPMAPSSCASACRSEAECAFWAFESGTCQIGCFDSQRPCQ